MKPEYRKLCQYLANGLSTESAAQLLNKNVRTVESWVMKLKEQYKAHNMVQLIHILTAQGDIVFDKRALDV